MELEQFVSYLWGWLSVQHKDTGAHSAITADSLAATGAISGSTGTFTGDVQADSDNTPVTIGGLVGTASGSVGRVGPGIDFNGTAGVGTFGRWTVVLEKSGSDRFLHFLDRNTGSESPFGIKYRNASNAYHVKPHPTTNATIPCYLGDPNDSFSAGRWAGAYLQSCDSGAGYFERSRTTAMGEWTSVSFNAANFSASTGNWTLQSGDQVTFAYTLVGKTMTVVFEFDGTDTSAVALTLGVAIPGGFTAAKRTRSIIQTIDNGGAAQAGVAFVNAAGTVINFQSTVAGGGWANTGGLANNTYVRGQITFEVQ